MGQIEILRPDGLPIRQAQGIGRTRIFMDARLSKSGAPQNFFGGKRRASRRENREEHTPENCCCQEYNIHLFANSNGLWKFVRTEKKSQKKEPTLCMSQMRKG